MNKNICSLLKYLLVWPVWKKTLVLGDHKGNHRGTNGHLAVPHHNSLWTDETKVELVAKMYKDVWRISPSCEARRRQHRGLATRALLLQT